MKVTAVVPAYNEEKIIGQVLTDLKNFVNKIIVVDDGSSDKTAEIAERSGAEVYRHFLNRGLGASLKTGFEAALKDDETAAVVTFDADGQHQASDILSLIQPIVEQKTDVVIGSRFLRIQKMPLLRLIYNWLANFITFLFSGLWVTDSQSGLRAFSKPALKKIEIYCDRMEISSEIIHQIKKQNLRFQEIPIKAIYTHYSLSKGQNFLLGIQTFFRLLIHKFS